MPWESRLGNPILPWVPYASPRSQDIPGIINAEIKLSFVCYRFRWLAWFEVNVPGYVTRRGYSSRDDRSSGFYISDHNSLDWTDGASAYSLEVAESIALTKLKTDFERHLSGWAHFYSSVLKDQTLLPRCLDKDLDAWLVLADQLLLRGYENDGIILQVLLK